MNGKFRAWDKSKEKYVVQGLTNNSVHLYIDRGGKYNIGIYSISLQNRYQIEYSTGHKDSNSQEWYVNDWAILDDYCIGILVYNDEMSCFGFNIHEGISINNYDDNAIVFEPLYYYNVYEMVIEGNIHEREVK